MIYYVYWYFMRLSGRVWRVCPTMKKQMLLLLLTIAMLFGCACAEGGSIAGCAYVDANGNAVCDSGDQLMSGVPLNL